MNPVNLLSYPAFVQRSQPHTIARTSLPPQGYNAADHILSCFGGAGGQHACSIARALGIGEVFIHRYAGILSAYGIGMADLVYEEQEPCSLVYSDDNAPLYTARLALLAERVRAHLVGNGESAECIRIEEYLNLRYDGTDTSIMVRQSSAQPFHQLFVEEYRRCYGFVLEGRALVVDDVRVRGVAQGSKIQVHKVAESTGDETPIEEVFCWFESGSQCCTPVFE
jgi:5-oxoprolinase (ATP-hydrolysing)